jgi:hypothetical protein
MTCRVASPQPPQGLLKYSLDDSLRQSFMCTPNDSSQVSEAELLNQQHRAALEVEC